MQTIRWGIIGCGDVTEIKSGPAFNKVADSKLVAVMRRNASKAEDYARRHGVQKWYSDAGELIEDPDINAVYIATPPAYHETYALQALQAGKSVYIEKPITMNTQGAKTIATEAQKRGVLLTPAHYRRELDLFKKVRSLLSENAIGQVRLVNLRLLQAADTKMIARSEDNWRTDPRISGGGLFHDLAPHQIDLMIWFFGEVSHAGGLALNQAGSYTADDLVCGHILFKDGVVFNGAWSFSVAAGEAEDICEIIGSKGAIRFATFGKFIELSTKAGVERFEFEMPLHIQQPMIEQVVKYFRGEAENPCKPEDAIAVMQVMDAFTARN